ADGYAGSSPVGAFPPNGFGLADMGGNVWNWCSDFYAAESHAIAKARGVCCDPAGPARSEFARPELAGEHVIKGGSVLCRPSDCAPRHALRHRFGAHRIPLRPGRVGEAVRSTNVNAKRILRGLLLSASLGALAACTSIDVKTTPYPGVAKYAATDPEKVEIL